MRRDRECMSMCIWERERGKSVCAFWLAIYVRRWAGNTGERQKTKPNAKKGKQTIRYVINHHKTFYFQFFWLNENYARVRFTMKQTFQIIITLPQLVTGILFKISKRWNRFAFFFGLNELEKTCVFDTQKYLNFELMERTKASEREERDREKEGVKYQWVIRMHFPQHQSLFTHDIVFLCQCNIFRDFLVPSL